MKDTKGLDKEYLYFYSIYILLGAINFGNCFLTQRFLYCSRYHVIWINVAFLCDTSCIWISSYRKYYCWDICSIEVKL